jgi:uncharacterized RDD family membrane protein YckC
MESLPLPASAARVSRRAMAWAIDFLIVLVPSVALLIAALTSLVHALPGYVGGVASTGLVNVIMHHGEGVGGLGAAASEEWTSFVQPLVWSLLAVPVIQFGYHGLSLAWRGRTLGAITMGVRVGAATDPTGLLRARALRRAFLTTLIESGFLCLALAVVTIGQLSIGGLLVTAAVLAFWLNLVMLLGPRRRTMVDRFAGTVVVRSARFGAAAVTGPAAVSSWPASVPALRPADPPRALTSEPPATGPSATGPSATGPSATGRAGQAAADAAAVAGQLARERAESIARSRPVQQALNSPTGQRAQELGARASDSARRLGGRAQSMWTERQRRREPGNALPPAEDEPPQ